MERLVSRISDKLVELQLEMMATVISHDYSLANGETNARNISCRNSNTQRRKILLC